MLTVGSLDPREFSSRLAADGVGVRLGPFDARIQAAIHGLAEPLHRLYDHYPLLDTRGRVYSFHVRLATKRRIWPRPERVVRFNVDGLVTHEEMPAAHALAALEWGVNLVVAMRFSAFLMLHSAAVERNGRVLLMPASPGHGKTTLCAALVHRGWRLFSDEFGMMRPRTGQFVPMPRPMPLKNESIAVIREFAPDAVLGPEIPGTRKGTVAHVRAPGESVRRASETAAAKWIVFPRWRAGVALSLKGLPPSEGFMRLATNAFNYEKLGATGFECLRQLVDECRCYSLEYSKLDDAVAALTQLADADAA
jgi:HprK-related kinase A